MDLDWNDLRFLLALHRGGSLAAAARAMGVSKATAGRHLASLESALGATLFERMPKGVRLTDTGAGALAEVEEIERLVARFHARVQAVSETEPRGKVRVTSPQFLAERYLVPGLADLKRAHPGLEVELHTSNRVFDIVRGEADIALRNTRPDRGTLLCRKVLEVGASVYGSRNYLTRRGRPTSRAELEGHDVLVYADIAGVLGFEWLKQEAPEEQIAFRANDPVSLLSAATAGLGLAALPCLLADPESSLERVPGLGFHGVPCYLILREDSSSIRRVRVVADFIVDMLLAHREEICG